MALWQTDRFADRADAGQQLADALSSWRGQHPLVLAIPRGGVPVGRIVADRLQGELDVVLVRKLGAPGYSEYAVGAIDENGHMQVSQEAALAGADERYLKREAAAQLATIRARRQRYSPHHTAIDPAGRVVIVVDDGLATGATMRAALQAVRARKPARLICAVPVAAPASLATVADIADDLIYLCAPAHFRAVGQFYLQFPPVDDEEVLRLLQEDPAAAKAGTETVQIPAGDTVLSGDLQIPERAIGLVIFAHGSGSSRNSPRNRQVARALHSQGLATLLFDLLTEDEARDVSLRFDIPKLASRLDAALRWSMHHASTKALPIGLFGASTGAAAALVLAARYPMAIRAVVSRGGRPDLAGHAALARVVAPVLLIVGAADTEVVALNRAAVGMLASHAEMVLIPNATHLFEEPGALEQAGSLAAKWFHQWLPRQGHAAAAATES